MIRRRPPTVGMVAQIVRDTPVANTTVLKAVPEHLVLAYTSTVLRCLASTAELWLKDAATAKGSPVMVVHLGMDHVEDVLIRHAEYDTRHETDEYGPGWAFDWAPAHTVPDLDLLWINDYTGSLSIRNSHRRQVGGRFVLLHEHYQQWRALHTQRIAGQRAVATLTGINNRKREAGDDDHDHLTAYGRALEDVRTSCFFEPADNRWLPTLAGLYEKSKQLKSEGIGAAHQPTYRRALAAVAARVLDCSLADAQPLLDGHEHLPATT